MYLLISRFSVIEHVQVNIFLKQLLQISIEDMIKHYAWSIYIKGYHAFLNTNLIKNLSYMTPLNYLLCFLEAFTSFVCFSSEPVSRTVKLCRLPFVFVAFLKVNTQIPCGELDNDKDNIDYRHSIDL